MSATTVKASEILARAKSLIRSKKSWIQGTSARSESGGHVDWNNPLSENAACEWCATGAVYQAGIDAGVADEGGKYSAEFNSASSLLDQVAVDIYGYTAVSVNDTLGHDEVLTIFDAAISRAKELEDSEDTSEDVRVELERLLARVS